METYKLGEVPFRLQNEETFNEDVYLVEGPVLTKAGFTDSQEVSRLIHRAEEPERFVLYPDGNATGVATKQPDAVLHLARLLNEKLGGRYTEEEEERLREELIVRQRAGR